MEIHMESLNLLENRVMAILAEVERLRSENAQLHADALAAKNLRDSLEEENASLKGRLEQETQAKEAVLTRIDGLIQYLKEYDTGA